MLMAGVASLAVMMASAKGALAEIVTVQGDDGAPGANGLPGGDGESVTANAGSALPVTAPLNKATARAVMAAKVATQSVASAAMVAPAVLRTPWRRRPSSQARPRRTPIRLVATAAMAA
jgi:hypothetical protein